MPTSLVSQVDKGFADVQIELPPGSQIEETAQVVDRVVKAARSHKEVESVTDTIGGGSGLSHGHVHINLKERDKRGISEDQFEKILRPELASIPGAHISFGGGWGSGQVQILLTGFDTAALDETSQQLIRGNAHNETNYRCHLNK